ncbi:hypothetical protein L9F63_026467, partial [Diploptera punctata]
IRRINPGLFAAYKGHHYAGPGNHFWKCLYLSGLTPEPMTADDDYKLLQVGIGFTNMVARATKGSADLTRKEIKEGSQILLEKLQKYKPKIAVFNGKLIFEVFSGKKDFSFGRQPDFVDGTNTYMWVMPSSSARCAQLPRAADKVPFYAALKKFRDYLNGIIADIDETEVVFTDSKLKNYFEPELKEEPKDEHTFYGYGRLATNGELTDLSNAIVKKEGEQPPAKKKRGRPKKIKSDCIEVKRQKKRGRPKKIKTDDIINLSSEIILDRQILNLLQGIPRVHSRIQYQTRKCSKQLSKWFSSVHPTVTVYIIAVLQVSSSFSFPIIIMISIVSILLVLMIAQLSSRIQLSKHSRRVVGTNLYEVAFTIF